METMSDSIEKVDAAGELKIGRHCTEYATIFEKTVLTPDELRGLEKSNHNAIPWC